MSTTENTPRSLDQLVKDFEASSGNFAGFHKGMSEREKILFKGWLHQMRSTPPAIG